MSEKKHSIFDCHFIELNNENNSVIGKSTNVCFNDGLPFRAKRIYYLYDVPGGESRAGHAHYNLYQIITAAAGSFDVMLDDGNTRKKVQLNKPHIGLLITPAIWREIDNFSSGAVCLVLASEFYDEKDYIREYDKFIDFRKTL